jgi:hypothetical protein
MTCDRARRLFGACWDDELTQGEREWLEGHFASCEPCRTEYDVFSRALEWTDALPRVEASPELLERVLVRTRRASAAPDHLGRVAVRWVPVAATAAAVLVVAALVVVPRVMRHPAVPLGTSPVAVQVERVPARLPRLEPEAKGVRLPERRGTVSSGDVAIIPDSLFDHSEDVEFILDPVTLHRGRPSVKHAAPRMPGVEGEQAIITF